MAQVLIRDLGDEVIGKLKLRAKVNRRSLQAELKLICEAAAHVPSQLNADEVRKLRQLFANRHFSDSSELIRADRER